MGAWLNTIKFSVLKHKKSLSNRQEKFVLNLLTQRGGSPLDIVSSLQSEALTADICSLAYLRESEGREDEVVKLTPSHCLEKITLYEFCLKAIEQNYKNFDHIDFSYFAKTNLEECYSLVSKFENKLNQEIDTEKKDKEISPNLEDKIKTYSYYQPLFIEANKYFDQQNQEQEKNVVSQTNENIKNDNDTIME